MPTPIPPQPPPVTGPTTVPGPGPIQLTSQDFKNITLGAQAFMDKAEADNKAAFDANGIGLLYGANSAFAKLSPSEKTRFVRNAVAKKDPIKARDPAFIAGLIKKLQATSCIGYALKVVGAGYAAAGKADRWEQIRQIVKSEGTIGTTLARELQADGWEAVYWNSDTTGYHGPPPVPHTKTAQVVIDQTNVFNPRFIDRKTGTFKPAFDQAGQPIPGRDYFKLFPRSGLLNFQPLHGRPNLDALAPLKSVPFFVGVAASGYHTILGQGTTLRDSHLMRNPDDRTNIENRPFYDITYEYNLDTKKNQPAPGGGFEPSIEQSGLIMVPPGTFGQPTAAPFTEPLEEPVMSDTLARLGWDSSSTFIT